MNPNRGHASRAEAPKCRHVKEQDHSLGRQYSEDGVDLTVIRWMLSMTPEQRLETLQNYVRTVLRIRGGQAGT